MVRHVLIRFKITGRWTTGNLWSFAVSQFQEQLLHNNNNNYNNFIKPNNNR